MTARRDALEPQECIIQNALHGVSSAPIYLILATPVRKAELDHVCERKASVQTDLSLLRCGE